MDLQITFYRRTDFLPFWGSCTHPLSTQIADGILNVCLSRRRVTELDHPWLKRILGVEAKQKVLLSFNYFLHFRQFQTSVHFSLQNMRFVCIWKLALDSDIRCMTHCMPCTFYFVIFISGKQFCQILPEFWRAGAGGSIAEHVWSGVLWPLCWIICLLADSRCKLDRGSILSLIWVWIHSWHAGADGPVEAIVGRADRLWRGQEQLRPAQLRDWEHSSPSSRNVGHLLWALTFLTESPTS